MEAPYEETCTLETMRAARLTFCEEPSPYVRIGWKDGTQIGLWTPEMGLHWLTNNVHPNAEELARRCRRVWDRNHRPKREITVARHPAKFTLEALRDCILVVIPGETDFGTLEARWFPTKPDHVPLPPEYDAAEVGRACQKLWDELHPEQKPKAAITALDYTATQDGGLCTVTTVIHGLRPNHARRLEQARNSPFSFTITKSGITFEPEQG